MGSQRARQVVGATITLHIDTAPTFENGPKSGTGSLELIHRAVFLGQVPPHLSHWMIASRGSSRTNLVLNLVTWTWPAAGADCRERILRLLIKLSAALHLSSSVNRGQEEVDLARMYSSNFALSWVALTWSLFSSALVNNKPKQTNFNKNQTKPEESYKTQILISSVYMLQLLK